MLEIQIGSESIPGPNIPLAQRLMLLLTRTAAMGFLPQDRITAIDAEAVRRVLAALQRPAAARGLTASVPRAASRRADWLSPLRPASAVPVADLAAARSPLACRRRRPANYFADTPSGAWAEFLRHEAIVDAVDLDGVRRSLWVVELPPAGYASPALDDATLFGGEASYPACQAQARRLRDRGATRIEARGAALLPGCAAGWTANPGLAIATRPRDGRVWVLFGPCDATGWLAVDGGAPPAALLPWVRPLG